MNFWDRPMNELMPLWAWLLIAAAVIGLTVLWVRR